MVPGRHHLQIGLSVSLFEFHDQEQEREKIRTSDGVVFNLAVGYGISDRYKAGFGKHDSGLDHWIDCAALSEIINGLGNANNLRFENLAGEATRNKINKI
jgi:hypothetical protein